MAQHNQLGTWGEKIAADLLVAKGYAIAATNWRSGHYEIDIIAQKGTRVVFVEVKTRQSNDKDAFRAFDRAKQRRLVYAAFAYMRANPSPLQVQYDFIAVVGEPHNFTVEHVEDIRIPMFKTYR